MGDPMAILTAQDLESIFEPESYHEKHERLRRDHWRKHSPWSFDPHCLDYARNWARGRLAVREMERK